jgi:hypothetical protein
VVIVINNSDKQVGLYSGGGGGVCIWNEVSVSTCGGLIHRGLYSGGLYSEVYGRPQSKMFALALHKLSWQPFSIFMYLKHIGKFR